MILLLVIGLIMGCPLVVILAVLAIFNDNSNRKTYDDEDEEFDENF